MAIDITAFVGLLLSLRYVKDKSNALTLGRPKIDFLEIPNTHYASMSEILGLLRFDKVLSILPSDYCENILRQFNFAQTDSIDASAHLNATITHNINTPYSSDNRYQYIYDVGTIQKLFHIPQAFENIINLLDVDGIFCSIIVNCNSSGNGFYKVTPQLFMSSFSEDYGMKIEAIYLANNNSIIDDWINLSSHEYEYGYAASNQTRYKSLLGHDYMITIARKVSNTRKSLLKFPPKVSSKTRDVSHTNDADSRTRHDTPLSISESMLLKLGMSSLLSCSRESVLQNIVIDQENPNDVFIVHPIDSSHQEYLEDMITYTNEKILSKNWVDAINYATILANEIVTYSPADMLSFGLLEKAICQIASGSLQATIHIAKKSEIKNVLHVATQLYDIGGHTRVLHSFIKYDPQRNHSLFLTTGNGYIPDFLLNSSINQIFKCDTHSSLSAQLLCAQQLRKVSLDYDLIILHIHQHDSVAVTAFSCGYHGPHVSFWDHADHTPWVGSSILDSRLVYRQVGYDLYKWRYIEKNRNILIPLPAEKNVDKDSARRLLGIKDTDILLLSMANEYKFSRHHNGIDLLKMITPILNEYPNVKYYAVGPLSWNEIIEELKINPTQVMFTERSAYNALLYHAAADVHIDSYPVNSILSLVESVLDGGVAIGYCPWKTRQDLILCTDPADYGSIDKSAIFSCPTSETFMNALRQLVSNISNLHSLQKIATDSMTQHWGLGWVHKMNETYERLRQMESRNRFDVLSYEFKDFHSSLNK